VRAKILPACGFDAKAHHIPIEPFRGECCELELARLASILTQKQVKVLVGMGGGKTIDTAKRWLLAFWPASISPLPRRRKRPRFIRSARTWACPLRWRISGWTTPAENNCFSKV
jgi:hypothetical protein